VVIFPPAFGHYFLEARCSPLFSLQKICKSLTKLCNISGFKIAQLCTEKINSQQNLNTMNKTEVKGNWNEQKGKLKQKFAVLTDNDLMYEEGKKDEMMGKLQIKLGKTKEELETVFSSL